MKYCVCVCSTCVTLGLAASPPRKDVSGCVLVLCQNISPLTFGACVSALSASVLFKCQVGCAHFGCS